MEVTVFAVCALIALAGSFGVVFARNPVHSALGLVATLFAVAVLFLNQEAHLLAAVQVIVYTGAIVVLILFVLMLLGVDKEEDLSIEPIIGQRYVALAVAALVGGLLLVVLAAGGDEVVTGARSVTQGLDEGLGDIRQLGQQLFTNYVFALQITAVLLTIAVVAAVVLARRPDRVQPLPDPEAFEEDDDRMYLSEEAD